MGKKGMNNAVAKNMLVNKMETGLENAKTARWYATEEGQYFLAKEAAKRQNDLLRGQFIIGQLVWKDDRIVDDMLTFSKVVARCGRITAIEENFISVEMLYALIDEVKVESYKSWDDNIWTKGDKSLHYFTELEKHVGKKSGSTWWKIIS